MSPYLVNSLILVWLESRIVHSDGLIDVYHLVWIHPENDARSLRALQEGERKPRNRF
jgi:hypothetical protein